jgi:mRNA-degrading endonuclease RelE of RelBE toxin-antitoxin system
MSLYPVHLTARFKKDVKKLSAQNQRLVLKTINIIKENSPDYPSLKTRKVTRDSRKSRKQLYESRVNDDIRLVWHFNDDRIIFMIRVGHHDVEKLRKVQDY